jgi:endonuclease/exonuclease/phosphatase family metal-dependent hydrolase
LSHAHAPTRRLSFAAITVVLALALLLPGIGTAQAGGKGHQKKSAHHSSGKVHRHGKVSKHRSQKHAHGKRHGHRHHHPGFPGKGKVVGTMTRNLYLGANLTPAIGAPTLEAFVAANGQILREVTANDFPTRAEGLADEILDAKPDLVGLQEVALWRTAPVDFEVLAKGPSATTVRYDYLQELLAELNQGKPSYEVVVVQDEFDLEAPADEDGDPKTGPLGADINGRLTMRDVILARRGAGVQTWNEQGANFETLLEVPILSETASLTIKRGWTATDAKVRGSHPFRFVNTHLEAFQALIRAAQATELVAPTGPATSDLPVVLLGDLNSDDDTVEGEDRLAYEALLAAGMVERSTNKPLSCCIESSLLEVGKGGSEADFDHQVDHIMTRDPADVTLQSSAVSGIQPVNGFWNSDHAGVFGALRFGH